MTTILKDELGFPGYLMSDWNAQTTTINSANSGLDMSMPGDDFSGDPSHVYWDPKLVASVENGSVPETRLNDMVQRNLASWYVTIVEAPVTSDNASSLGLLVLLTKEQVLLRPRSKLSTKHRMECFHESCGHSKRSRRSQGGCTCYCS